MTTMTDYTSSRQSSGKISFFDVIRESTPAFIFEDLPNSKSEYIAEMSKHFGYFLDALYDKVKDIYSDTTITDNKGEYLYELGTAIGLDNIVQLSNYLNSDGSINTALIDEYTYNLQVENQKTQLKNAITVYLSKGTLFGIKNMFSSYGGRIDIEELWYTTSQETFDVFDNATGMTGDNQRGPVFDPIIFSIGDVHNAFIQHNNSLLTKYGDASFGSLSAYNYEDVNIADEISSFCNELSGGNFNLIDYQNNFKNYYYILTSSMVNGISGTYLYYKTNDEPLIDGINPNSWYRFAGVHEISGNIAEIKQSEKYLFIRYTNNNLDVYDIELDSNNLLFSIDNMNCFFVGILEEINTLLIDRGTYIDIRGLEFFDIKGSTLKTNTYPIRFAIKNQKDEYVIIDSSNYCYMLIDLLNAPTLIDYGAQIKDNTNTIYTPLSGFYLKDNNQMLFANGTTTMKKIQLIVSSAHAISCYASDISSDTTQILDIISYYEKIIILSNSDNLYFFDLTDSSVTNTSIINKTGCTNIFMVDKINIYSEASNTLLQKIIGFSTGTNILRKTHYFNATVVRSLETYKFLNTYEKVLDLINIMKPVHTKLLQLTIYDDFGAFGYGTNGIGRFGNGEYSAIQ